MHALIIHPLSTLSPECQSGIIGWPPDTTLPGVITTDQYQIGIDATSRPKPQDTYWDYMPICKIPTITTAGDPASANIYKAYGGLRLKKFVDAFNRPPDPNTFSVCNSDFSPAMTQIGNAIVKALKPGCVPYPLKDTDPNTAGIQPECQVMDMISCDTPGKQGTSCLSSGYSESPLPECQDPTSGLPLDPANPQTANIPDSARPCWYLSYDMDPVVGCPDAPSGQRISALRPAGTVAPAGTQLWLTCLTCPASNPDCSVAGH